MCITFCLSEILSVEKEAAMLFNEYYDAIFPTAHPDIEVDGVLYKKAEPIHKYETPDGTRTIRLMATTDEGREMITLTGVKPIDNQKTPPL